MPTNLKITQLTEITTPSTNDVLPIVNISGDVTSKVQATNLIGATTATLTNKTFNTAGTGNSFAINSLAVTANTGTGAVVRATSPTLVTPSSSGDITVLAGASLALKNALGNSTAFVFNNGGTGANIVQTASPVAFGADLKIAVPTNVSTSAVTTDATQTLTNKTMVFASNTPTNFASLTTTQTFSGKKTFAGTASTITAYSPAGAATATLDLNLGDTFTVNVPAGNITLAFSNGTTGQWFTVRFVNDASVRTISYPITIKWPGGSAPALSGTAGRVDIFRFLITGAATYDGTIVGANLS